jgi:prevent-host-death family protein
MDVGIRELKQRLSEYLDRAARGETIRVTDRGHPKAILGPLPGAMSLEEGIARGWISRAAETTPPVPVPRARAKRRSEDVLREDREDREDP